MTLVHFISTFARFYALNPSNMDVLLFFYKCRFYPVRRSWLPEIYKKKNIKTYFCVESYMYKARHWPTQFSKVHEICAIAITKWEKMDKNGRFSSENGGKFG